MNRRSIFGGIAALFAGGVARGQEKATYITGSEHRDPGNIYTEAPELRKPNQCPVCGTLAEPYKRPTELEAYGSAACLSGGGTSSNVFSVCVRPSDTKLTGPMERITRCRKCNAAFYQDAQE